VILYQCPLSSVNSANIVLVRVKGMSLPGESRGLWRGLSLVDGLEAVRDFGQVHRVKQQPNPLETAVNLPFSGLK